MIGPLLSLFASSAACLASAVLTRRQLARGPAPRAVVLPGSAAAVWRNALSATLLLCLGCGVALSGNPGDPGARLTEGLCLATGLMFLLRVAVLLQRLRRAGVTGAAAAGRLLFTGPAGSLAAAWALLRSPLAAAAEPAAATVPARLDGAASAALRCDPWRAELPKLPLAGWRVPALLALCALLPPVDGGSGMHWALLFDLPAGTAVIPAALAGEMLLVIGLAALHGWPRKL